MCRDPWKCNSIEVEWMLGAYPNSGKLIIAHSIGRTFLHKHSNKVLQEDDILLKVPLKKQFQRKNVNVQYIE